MSENYVFFIDIKDSSPLIKTFKITMRDRREYEKVDFCHEKTVRRLHVLYATECFTVKNMSFNVVVLSTYERLEADDAQLAGL